MNTLHIPAHRKSGRAGSVLRWLAAFDPFGPYSPQPARR